ncbi:amino acid ABC transporter permease [Egicoccus sp. AB-alg6-2]|uniref:amino acid ABC transporter permease n=1 Tax=Egicoccus sp. AB-alg6-2 TaxID=3242692 RepID=UPI00359DE846
MTKRQRQRLIRLVMYALFFGVIALLVAVADWPVIRRNFFNVEIAREMFPRVLTVAARNTVFYTFLAFVFGLGLGLLLALMRLSTIGPYRWFARIYIEIFRGLPALVTIFLVGLGIPIAFRVRWNILIYITLGLGLVAAAYMAETIRAGIEGVPKGQMEAARSLGMSYSRAMLSIVIPQGFRIIIPPLTNELVLLIKDTSLLFVLGTTPATVELLKFGRQILDRRANATPLIVIALVYLAITVPLTQLVAMLERRNRRAR